MPLKACLPCCRRQRWQGGHTTHVAVVLQLSQNKSMMTPITEDRRQSQNQRQLTPIGKREKQILTINMPPKTCLQSCRRQWWQRWGYRNLIAMDTW